MSFILKCVFADYIILGHLNVKSQYKYINIYIFYTDVKYSEKLQDVPYNKMQIKLNCSEMVCLVLVCASRW